MQRILCGCVLGCWVVSTPLTGWSQTTMPVPDTGQTTCYDAAGTVIDCPSPGEPFHGQDGNYTINAPSYTDLGNGVVLDNVTGLHWEVKTNKDSAPNYDDPRDRRQHLHLVRHQPSHQQRRHWHLRRPRHHGFHRRTEHGKAR